MTRHHPTVRTRLVAAVAVGLAGAGLLSGCAGQPGAAAVVDGQAIRTSDLTATIDELAPAYSGVSAQAFLGALIIEPTLSQVADDLGLGVSDEDAVARLTEDFTKMGATAPTEFSPASVAIGRYQATAAKLTSTDNADRSDEINQALTDAIGKLDVEVNPRFGQFDATSGQVAALDAPAWMVTSSS